MIRMLAVAGVALSFFTLGQAASAQEWASVKGKIVWKGEVPKPMPLNVGASPDAAYCLAKGPVLDETYVVNPENKGLRWTFVWLAPMNKGDKIKIKPELAKIPAGAKNPEIDQPICSFIPHAIAVREGQKLIVLNSAKVAHNFKWTGNPTNSNGNVLLPPGGKHEIDNLKADRLPWTLECNIHPWMKGMMMVYDHPYFAVTDSDGNFEIKDAPTGPYRLMVRHSNGIYLGGAKGKDGKEITLKAGSNDAGALEFSPPQ
jgi:hypothetical protein